VSNHISNQLCTHNNYTKQLIAMHNCSKSPINFFTIVNSVTENLVTEITVTWITFLSSVCWNSTEYYTIIHCQCSSAT